MVDSIGRFHITTMGNGCFTGPETLYQILCQPPCHGFSPRIFQGNSLPKPHLLVNREVVLLRPAHSDATWPVSFVEFFEDPQGWKVSWTDEALGLGWISQETYAVVTLFGCLLKWPFQGWTVTNHFGLSKDHDWKKLVYVKWYIGKF